MSPYVEVIVCLAVVPVAVSITIGLITRNRSEKMFRLIRPFVVDGGFLGAFVAVPWTQAIPRQSWMWIPYFTGTAVALSASAWMRHKSRSNSNCLWALFLLGAASLLIPASVGPPAVRCGWIVGMALTMLTTLHCQNLVARRCHPLFVALCWALICTATATVLLNVGTVRFAELAIALGATTLGGALIAALHADRSIVVYAAPTISIALPALIFNGYLQQPQEVPLASAVLLLAAPIVILLVQQMPARRWRFRWRAALQTACMTFVLAAAVVAAVNR